MRESKKQDTSSYCSFPPCLDVNLIAVFQLTGHHTELNSHPHQKSHFTYTTRFLETQTAIFIISHDTLVVWFSNITGTMAPKLHLTPLPCTGTSCPPAPTSCIPGAQRHTHTQPGHSSEVAKKKKKRQKNCEEGQKGGRADAALALASRADVCTIPGTATGSSSVRVPFPSLQNSCLVA